MNSPGGCLRNTSVLVASLETSEVYIIVSLSTRNDTQVIYIDPTTGALCYLGKPGHDIFSSEDEALNHITNESKYLCKSTTYARAILGYSALGSSGLLLVATRLNATVPNLPGGGCIYTVTETQWIKIPLQYSQPQGKGEIKNIQELKELDIDGKHYFCETRDITRPFPSRVTFRNPDDEFVWNGWFSKPFKDIGLPVHCVVLLQGFAESRSLAAAGQQGGVVALLARRSRLHPGTRYLARGLNACSSTGNEVECEQLVWVPQSSGQIPVSSYIWRRGTIPIWWGADLKFTAAEAEIYVSAQDPFRGSLLYYKRLSKRYGAQSSDLSRVGQKKVPLIPIVCVNLLRYGLGKPETILVEHFKESLKYIRSTGKLSKTWIQLINYDWHATVKSEGEQQTVEGLWKHLKAPTLTIGFCEGMYIPSAQRLKESKGLIITNDDIEGGYCLKSLQNGVIRFNCADSLDRTNAASFFGALQVFVEQCSRLGISLDKDAYFGFSSMNSFGESGNYGRNTGLPEGWEERSDAVTGKPYYINHRTRTTTWDHPRPDKSWKRFDMGFDQFKSSTTLIPVNQLADLFLLAGDIHATLYTGSKAMHSQILNIFSDEGGKFSKFSAAQNVRITLQRRYQNVLVDSSRQKQLEMFLGLRLFKHLPSIPFPPLKVFSRPFGCFLKPVASMYPIANDGSSLLSFKKKDIIWVCPQAADVVELFIYIGEPCHVCQLLLTIPNGAEYSSYPGTVDIRTGRNLDGLKLVLEGASIPQCSNETNLLIPLTGRVDPEDLVITGNSAHLLAQENSNLPLLYDFEEVEGELDFLTRIVALTFYPSVPGRTPVTLGEIEVLGVSLPWDGMISKSGFGLQFLERLQERPKPRDPSSRGSKLTDSRNPFLHDSYSDYDKVASPLTQPSGVTHSIDLLTGDLLLSESISQPVVPNLPERTGSQTGGIIDFHDTYNADGKFSATYNADGKFSAPSARAETEDNGDCFAKHYIDCLKSFLFPQKGKKVDFVLAMKLEIVRLRLNLSAAERDRALVSIGIVPATIDPNNLIDESYMIRLCKYTDSLALLGQTAFEDQINGSIGLERVDEDVVDLWNIGEVGETCSSNECEVRADVKSSAKASSSAYSSRSSQLFLVCSQCGRKTCKVCCAGKGAALLSNINYKEMKIYTGLFSYSDPDTFLLDGVICKSCCSEVILHAVYVDYIRVLSSLRRRSRADRAAEEALEQVVGHGVNSISNNWQDTDTYKRQWENLLNGEESLAEFPYASLLHTVETTASSEPLLSLLSPPGTGDQHSYWSAPPNVSTVEFSIVLGTLSDISGVALIVSSCGYSTSDCPMVQIWASNKIHREERSFVGKWDMQTLVSSSPKLYGPVKSDKLRHVKFPFRNPVRCRIIWITLTLPQRGSSSVNLDQQYNLLALDENPFASVNDHDSKTIESDPCIHAKRVIVFGNSLRKVMDLNASQMPDMMRMRSFSDGSPRQGRFRIPVEAERLSDNDLVLEQYLSSNAPGLAGYRLDAFNVIVPRITHSPPSLNMDIWDSLTCLEDRHIKPAVLYIQVSAVQESRNVVTVGEYRLPIARAGTALYFDFPRPIYAQRIIFKLLGDVTAFADDIPQQDDLGFRSLPLASGLSLSNKIKLYYYADPYELGKLAALSAV